MTSSVMCEMRLRAMELRLMAELEKLEARGGLFLGCTWSNEALEIAHRLDGVHGEMERFGMRPMAMEEEDRVLVAA